MIKNLKKSVIGIGIFLLFLPSVFADYLPVQVYATDTVAGYPSALRTSLIEPNRSVRFVVEKPDGAIVQVPAQADLEGVAKTDFYGHQTKNAGVYKVSVVYPGSEDSSPISKFTVYPDSISSTQSSLRATLQMAEAGKDTTFLIATLYDQYMNPIPNHKVKLISSRSDDRISALQDGITDDNGRANFKVNSFYPGISVFTAIDSTVSQELKDREEVVFFANTAPSSAQSLFGASLFGAEIGGDEDVLPGPIDHFSIEGLPSNAKVGQELSMSVVAKDKNGNTAKNYTGTILIAIPDDDNAVLPNNGEYTFKESDQGKFTFALSLIFSKQGSQSVQIFDKNNFKISGEFPIEIITGGAVIPGPTGSSLSIKSPLDGTELGSTYVIISGQGPENINMKIFDNDTKVGDSETDSDGFFSFEVKNLDNGTHTFYLMSESGEVSKAVTITIDTIPPVLNSILLYPEGDVVPGDTVSLSITSEPDLETAKISFQSAEDILEESSDEPGTYTADITAPEQEGDYPVNVILIDSLGNKAEFMSRGTVSVKMPIPDLPSKVTGLEGEPGDGVVALSWEPVEDHERPIQNYRIYYGSLAENLDKQVNTYDDAPEWELRNLTNGKQYFIAIKAVDTQGIESADMSVTIAVTPFQPDPCIDIDCGEHGVCFEGECQCVDEWSGEFCEIEPDLCGNIDCGDNGICEDGECMCIGGWGGPFCEIEPSQPDKSIQTVTYDSAVNLSWKPFPGVQAYYYKIYFGLEPGNYMDYMISRDNTTDVTVPDLVNGVEYYFAVQALDINKTAVSPLSEEMTAVPSGSGFRPAAPSPVPTEDVIVPFFPYDYYAGAYDTGASGIYDQLYYEKLLKETHKTSETGPEAIWIVVVSMIFAHFLYHHKKKLISNQ